MTSTTTPHQAKIILIQEGLSNLNESNYDEVRSTIEKAAIDQLQYTFQNFILLRPYRRNIYLRLYTEVCSPDISLLQSHNLLASSNRQLVHAMMKAGKLSKEDVVNEIIRRHDWDYPQTSDGDNQKQIIQDNFSLFAFFAPEIAEINPNFFAQSLEENKTYTSWEFYAFKRFISDFQENDWARQRKTVETGYDIINSVAHALINDDIESYQQLTHEIQIKDIYVPLLKRYGLTHLDPISFAALYGSVKCLKFMMLNGVPPTNITFQMAVANGSVEIVRILEQAHCNSSGARAAAAYFHQNDIFEYLDTPDDDIPLRISQSDNVALAEHGVLSREAAKCNSVDLPLDIDYKTLLTAVENHSDDVVRYFLQNHNCAPLVDKGQMNALHIAAQNGGLAMAKMIVESGQFDLNQPNMYGLLPIHLATSGEHYDIALYLSEQPCIKVNEYTQAEQTIVMQATQKRGLRFLAVVKADPNLPDAWMYTPLHQAVSQGDPELVKVLLARGDINIDAVECNQMTSLYIAVEKGYTEIAQLLIQAGADCTIRPAKKKTAKQLAIAKRNDAMIALFV